MPGWKPRALPLGDARVLYGVYNKTMVFQFGDTRSWHVLATFVDRDGKRKLSGNCDFGYGPVPFVECRAENRDKSGCGTFKDRTPTCKPCLRACKGAA